MVSVVAFEPIFGDEHYSPAERVGNIPSYEKSGASWLIFMARKYVIYTASMADKVL
jgi:hypothetical protein